MPMPPYNELMHKLKDLVKRQPLLGPTLLPVIAYLEHTSEIYEQFVLDSLSDLDDEEW